MRATWTILRREVYALFVSPMAWVTLTVWLVWCGFQFFLLALYFTGQSEPSGPQDSPLTMFFGATTLFYLPLLVFVPLITMRLLAEEQSRGTIELLMTAPVTEAQVVIGKYGAAMVFWLAMWLPTGLYVYLTSVYGHVDLFTVLTSYLGILGFGAYYIALGTLMSALSKNQIVAALLTFFVLAVLFMVSVAGFLADEHRDLFAYLSIWGHMESFSRGVVDSRYLVFDSTVTATALAFAIGALKLRRLEG
ncbi:MAG TPA: hypothetical protein DEF51_19495 [Myxococcales bacterium]|nr:hypothetical protein [Myxococcales bacterium]